MSNVKYLFQFLIIIITFIIFKLLGLKFSRILSSSIFKLIGPKFRSLNTSNTNLLKAMPKSNENQRKEILNSMWGNYGKIFAEYIFLKDFRNNSDYIKNIIIENKQVLENIRLNSKPVIFISGHFNNFELMAMQIEKSGVKLSAVYRPINNIYLNPIMEKIRKKYICKDQIKKGISGTKELLKKFKSGNSVALMIDQRVSEGIRCPLFNDKAFTTTIPAQFVKKFEAKIVPVYIERTKDEKFKLKIYNPLEFSNEETIESITKKLNNILEQMISKNPEQWIWTHNRWK